MLADSAVIVVLSQHLFSVTNQLWTRLAYSQQNIKAFQGYASSKRYRLWKICELKHFIDAYSVHVTDIRTCILDQQE